jgi:hypothetical protein
MSPLTHGISRSTLYILVMIYVSLLAVVAAGIWYTNYTAEQNNRRWCGTLAVFHHSYQENPPPPGAGRDIRRQLDQLYTDFHCASVSKP